MPVWVCVSWCESSHGALSESLSDPKNITHCSGARQVAPEWLCVCACLGVCVYMRSAINPETMDEDILMYSAQLKHKANYAQLIRSLYLFPSSSVSLILFRSLFSL